MSDVPTNNNSKEKKSVESLSAEGLENFKNLKFLPKFYRRHGILVRIRLKLKRLKYINFTYVRIKFAIRVEFE